MIRSVNINFKLFVLISISILVSFGEASKIKKETDTLQQREFKPFLGEKWIGNAACYGPYRAQQAPGQLGPTKEQIKEDLDIISKSWNMIRVYNADIDTRTILEAIRETELPIKLMLGVWLEKEHSEERKEANLTNVEYAIDLANEFKNEVIAVSVGNETQVFWSAHRMNVNNLIVYIRMVRKGISQPVTCADDYNFWKDDTSGVVSQELDFITLHAHPAWNGLNVQNSVQWLDSIYKAIKTVHPNKNIIMGETGWPTNFNKDKVGDGQQGTLITGEVCVEAQKEFYGMYNKWVNENKITSFIFEVFDEPWKGGGTATGENEVEKHWGLFYENRTPKFIN